MKLKTANRRKKFTLGVFLPAAYQGGSLRGAKNIAKMLKLGSQYHGEEITVVFSCVENVYDIKQEFADLLELDIVVRETKWAEISREEADIAMVFNGGKKLLNDEGYLVPTDGIANFSDCDFWLIVSDRTELPLLPTRPYGVVIYDYIQRYVPEIFGSYFERPFLSTARKAEFIFVTTPQTRNDVIQYVGISSERVILIPMEFNSLSLMAEKSKRKKDYFIWTTNSTDHKNHFRAFEALDIYYKKYAGNFDIYITGPFSSIFFDKDIEPKFKSEHVLKTRKLLKEKQFLKSKINILGNLQDDSYTEVLANARFLWHPTLIDNGTFSVIEAAYYEVPSLSSDYPQMQYIDQRFKLNLSFTDPLCSETMAEDLAKMEKNCNEKSQLLPDKEYLGQFTYKNLAPNFWTIVRERL